MGYYEITVQSHVDHRRLRDFGQLNCKHLPNGKTLFFGTLKDQAELFSVLSKIRDMNLTLVTVIKDEKEIEV